MLYRLTGDEPEVLLVHPGGPYWKKKQVGAWMIPKGGVDPGETPAAAAAREFQEETGSAVGGRPFHLCRIRQAGGKIVEVFAAEGDFDPAGLTSLEFEMEWPPRSGSIERFPEIDGARWMNLAEARRMMLESQQPILDALEKELK